jgi:hypothetical protein
VLGLFLLEGLTPHVKDIKIGKLPDRFNVFTVFPTIVYEIMQTNEYWKRLIRDGQEKALS